MTSQTEHTTYLLLRKSVYSESSLIVAGVSPEHGQLHFLIRGARRINKKSSAQIDIVRVFETRFRKQKSGLHTWEGADFIEDFSSVARDPSAYWVAGRLARFALANVYENAECSRFFQALRQALRRLSAVEHMENEERNAVLYAAEVGGLLTFLSENGLLPQQEDSKKQRQIDALLAMASGQKGIPRLAAEDWERLQNWCYSLLRFGEHAVPD